MPLPSLTDLIPVLQIAVGPVILISGAGLVLLSMTNRLGRAIDRARILKEELPAHSAAEQPNTRAQLRILRRRAQLLRQAIILVSLLRWDAGWLILLLFVGCLGALIGGMVRFIEDVNQSLAALELDLAEGERPNPTVQ